MATAAAYLRAVLSYVHGDPDAGDDGHDQHDARLDQHPGVGVQVEHQRLVRRPAHPRETPCGAA